LRQKLRPVPFQLRDAVTSEIEKQIELDIMERVTDEMGSTPTPVIKEREIRKARNAKCGPSRSRGAKHSERLGPKALRLTVDNICQNKAIQRSKLNMTDDLLVFGKTEEEHQRALLCGSPKTQRERERADPKRRQLPALPKRGGIFYDMRFSEEGNAPTEDRVRTIEETRAPTGANILHTAFYAPSSGARGS
jgi:hypothetical protein